MKQKIYISGKITGLEPKQAFKKFEKAEEFLKNYLGYNVINPIKQCPQQENWSDYMLKDIELLFDCDAIYMLSNWQDSKGARIEHAIAKELGLRILYFNTFENLPPSKKVLQLDKNFHVYVHGKADLISKGHCPVKGNYLKLYYEQIK
jgi:hypothetical protein